MRCRTGQWQNGREQIAVHEIRCITELRDKFLLRPEQRVSSILSNGDGAGKRYRYFVGKRIQHVQRGANINGRSVTAISNGEFAPRRTSVVEHDWVHVTTHILEHWAV